MTDCPTPSHIFVYCCCELQESLFPNCWIYFSYILCKCDFSLIYSTDSFIILSSLLHWFWILVNEFIGNFASRNSGKKRLFTLDNMVEAMNGLWRADLTAILSLLCVLWGSTWNYALFFPLLILQSSWSFSSQYCELMFPNMCMNWSL